MTTCVEVHAAARAERLERARVVLALVVVTHALSVVAPRVSSPFRIPLSLPLCLPRPHSLAAARGVEGVRRARRGRRREGERGRRNGKEGGERGKREEREEGGCGLRSVSLAGASVALNVSEGTYSRGKNRVARYHNALGSARETLACLEVAEAFGYVGRVDEGLRADFARIIGTLARLV
jgi:hypothetical protein